MTLEKIEKKFNIFLEQNPNKKIEKKQLKEKKKSMNI